MIDNKGVCRCPKKRVHEIAKEFGVESKQVISILQQHNVNVTKAVNSVDDSGYEIVKKQLSKKSEAPKVAQKTEQKVEQKICSNSST